VFAGEREVAYENTFARCKPLVEAMREDITFVGLIFDPQRMANFYSICDVFALPSRTDMMALVQVEAMLCGTPVVASDIPGARVVVQETGFGQLSPPKDPKRLAEVIVDTLNNLDSYRPSINGVRAVFNTIRTLEKYEKILESISSSSVVTGRPSADSLKRSTEIEGDGAGE
jgi:glycosyltransferase involved in cell wall biosynthesis